MIPTAAAIVRPVMKLVDDEDRDLLYSLLMVWAQKRRRNMLRTAYFEGKEGLRDFGISIPPAMQSAFVPLQWIAKGVHALTDRSQFDGFVDSSGSDDPFEIASMLDGNEFDEEFAQAKVSSAIHATSFLTVTRGDVASGEPLVLILARAADASAAIWDRRRRGIKGFLSIVEVDDEGVPSEVVMYTPTKTYAFHRTGSGWYGPPRPHSLGETPAFRLPYHPELGRPFGHSRISRTAMGLTDAAVRTLLRAEVSAEFYSADSWWLFGADVTKFIGDDKWTAMMGRLKALDVDNPEQKPDLHHFQGASPQPHVDLMRMLSSLFADDQGLDVKWADSANPSSADAIYAAKEELIMDTRQANTVWGRGAVRAVRAAIRLRDGDRHGDDLLGLSAQFVDPAIVAPSARADAFSKLSAGIEGFGTTRVGMEFAGLSRPQIDRLRSELERNAATGRIAQLAEIARGASGDADVSTGGDALTEANVLKAKADALGVLRRAGVDAADAARLAGLEDVTFIPGQPITIKSAEE